MNINKNDILKINIIDFTFDGIGIGKLDSFPIFVVNTAVGDEAIIKIIKVKKSFAIGKLEKILTPSTHRIESDCPYYPQCGGCSFRHINYDFESYTKALHVKDTINRIGGINNTKINPIIKANEINNYRNKVQLPITKDKEGHYILGYYAKHSHRVIKCETCKLHPQQFNKIINIFKKWAEITNQSVYDESTNKGLLRHLYIRFAKETNEIMVCIVINGAKLKNQDLLIEMLTKEDLSIKSISLNINTSKTNVILGDKTKTIWGKDYITNTLCGLKFNISPNSFFQINDSQTEKLYNLVKQYANLSPTDIVWDLYCGTGTIGLTLANECKELLGIEIVPQAIENAKINSHINNIKNAKFICTDIKKVGTNLLKTYNKPNIIILDPPRKGCDIDVINFIATISSEKIIYVSCNPATLARDLKIFEQKGFLTKEITPVDMFPRTYHVESVVLLTKVHK